jgi:hypothetical protein
MSSAIAIASVFLVLVISLLGYLLGRKHEQQTAAKAMLDKVNELKVIFEDIEKQRDRKKKTAEEVRKRLEKAGWNDKITYIKDHDKS